MNFTFELGARGGGMTLSRSPARPGSFMWIVSSRGNDAIYDAEVGRDLGFGRVVASGREAPNMLANLV